MFGITGGDYYLSNQRIGRSILGPKENNTNFQKRFY